MIEYFYLEKRTHINIQYEYLEGKEIFRKIYVKEVFQDEVWKSLQKKEKL